VVDQKIAAAQALNPGEILSDTEMIIFQVLKEHGPVMQRLRFEELCLNAGVNRHSFWIFLSYCPIIARYGPGVYGLRGAEVPAGLVEDLMPKRTGKSKLLADYGWAGEQQICIIYKLSSGTLSNGIVNVPAALRSFLQGRFALRTADHSAVGTLVIKDNCAWGLGPFFSRRGGEPGDYLSILFDLSRHEATVQIGDASLTDGFPLRRHGLRLPTSTGFSVISHPRLVDCSTSQPDFYRQLRRLYSTETSDDGQKRKRKSEQPKQ
jgi:hypothetical protein